MSESKTSSDECSGSSSTTSINTTSSSITSNSNTDSSGGSESSSSCSSDRSIETFKSSFRSTTGWYNTSHTPSGNEWSYD